MRDKIPSRFIVNILYLNMNILITGVAGFIGSKLSSYLLKKKPAMFTV